MTNPAIVSRVDSTSLPSSPSPLFQVDTTSANPASHGSRRLKLGATMRRYWWVFGLLFLLFAVPSIYYVMTSKKYRPYYTATGEAQVAPTELSWSGSGNTGTTPYYSKYLNTQVAIMHSSRVLSIAAQDPRLNSPLFAWFQKLPDQIAYLRANVVVFHPMGTELVRVEVNNPRRIIAKNIVNAVLSAYMVVKMQDQGAATGSRLKLLKSLRDSTEHLLNRDQTRLHSILMRRSSGVLISLPEEKTVDIKMLSTMETSLQALKSDQFKLRNNLEALKKAPTVQGRIYEKSVNTSTDPQIQQWQAERIHLKLLDAKLAADAATRHHPQRMAIRRRLRWLNRSIATRAQAMRQHVYDRYVTATTIKNGEQIRLATAALNTVQQQIKGLQTQITETQKHVRHLNNTLEPIIALKQQIKSCQESLKQYVSNIQNIENQNRSPGRVSISNPATRRGEQSTTKRVKMVAAAGIGSFILALFITLLLGHFTGRIETVDDLPDSLRPLVVGTVSNAGLSTRGVQGKMKRKILGEEMRLVHANLLPPGHHNRRTIMITSPTPGNGKTSIAGHLALSLAKSGLSVLVIDGDLRKRDLSTMFETEFKPGLAELLQGQKPELLHPVELLPNFSVMGAGAKLDRNPAELFQARHLRECLDTLDEKFDIIIVDTPPILVVAEARLMARSCDEVLCVVRSQLTSHKEVEAAVEAITRISGEMPKLIINGVQQSTRYYKYKYSYMDRTIPADETPAAVG